MQSMKDLITPTTINMNLKAQTKDAALQELAESLYNAGKITNLDSYLADVIKREALTSTYMGDGIAIPHAKSQAVKSPVIAFGRSKEGVNYDNNIANLFFMIAVPEESSQEHLEILANLARGLSNEEFKNTLLQTNSIEDVLVLLQGINPSDTNTNQAISNKNGYDLVAITACSVGIAHTYIAAENLVKAANKMGYTIKVQTNGSIGIKNQLTNADIIGAKAVIIASDIGIDDAVFVGKHIVKTKVKEAVHTPEKLVEKALSSKIIVASKTNSSSSLDEASTPSFSFYKDLMSGVSHMIPFIVMGGVFIALAIAFSGITPGKGAVISSPFLKTMADIGGLAFSLVPAILAGYIAFSISGRPALAPGMVGGFVAQTIGAGFLGGLVAGFVAGYIIRMLLKIPFNKTLQTIVPVLFIPVVGGGLVVLVMEVIGLPISSFMVGLTAMLNGMLINGSALILYFILGLMVAADMGGPINKVAFLFGATMIQQGIPQIMGAVSVAICIPPLAMGLVSLIDKKYYSIESQNVGKAAILLGLVGITEGAIPFAAANPFKVIPSIMLGSATGALVGGMLKVADYAPHGGPIVLPVVEHRLSWVIAVLVGVAVTIGCNMVLNRVSFVNKS